MPPTAESPPATRSTVLPRLALLAAVVAVGVGVWLSGAADVLSFETLSTHRAALQDWVAAHGVLAAAAFVAAYGLVVGVSLPGAVWMTIAGGFLFGTAAGAAYAVVGATAGAVVVFLLARTVFREAWAARAGGALARMEDGFRRDAFSYLLVLRLVPLFPFWLVNLVPALLGVRLSTYTMATAIGIVPGAVVYAGVGNGLDAVFAAGGRPDLSIVWSPEILLPLLGLSLLALVPVAYRRWRARHDR
ncbi:TVP38/TMEM64 family protein [Caenispirillum bisanense]|uniref:TVP38/TMEM64 family membrane protein n=1 Tax=Caenispirillum bisanense TaxID=414052 RepID=A0A286GBM6_9PROT|nr:VTT domain-containing protein [Caenispirillum bisanense]SOD92646.1 Uncharacterized membrane protein YdjX, TVP38/TMEM64 family, SNARE-associated domain [Caenispirillum bisanense]